MARSAVSACVAAVARRRPGARAQDEDATQRDARVVPGFAEHAGQRGEQLAIRCGERPVLERISHEQLEGLLGDRLFQRDEHAPVGDGHQFHAGKRGQPTRRRDQDHRPAAEGRHLDDRGEAACFCASASRTMARPRSASTALSRSITSSGNVRVTVRAGRLNLRGRPRRTSRMGIFYSVMHPHAPDTPTPPHPHAPTPRVH